MNVNIRGGENQLFGESWYPEQTSSSGAALTDHDFCDIGKPDIFRDLQWYILAVCHNDLGAEFLRELYVLRKSGLILIIYDRIRLHIDGGKSCMTLAIFEAVCMIFALDGEEDRQTRICSSALFFDCSVCVFIWFTVLLFYYTSKS